MSTNLQVNLCQFIEPNYQNLRHANVEKEATKSENYLCKKIHSKPL